MRGVQRLSQFLHEISDRLMSLGTELVRGAHLLRQIVEIHRT